MATYAELLTASEDSTLNNKMRVAVIIAANTIAQEAGATTNHANRMLWAKAAFKDPASAARSLLWSVLAQNAGATFAQIVGASDATVQTAVNSAIDVFANGA